MTDTYGATPIADEIDDSPSAELDRRADRILAEESRSFGTSARGLGSIRQAVRQDAAHGRLWATDRAGRVSEVIREEPLKATAYAVVAGLVVGLLLRR